MPKIIIARSKHPAVRLVPLAAVQVDRSRLIGAAKGRFEPPEPDDALNAAVQYLPDGLRL